MAGHSKWNNIKARKGKQDAKRGKIFTKIGREIAVAVREGGPDPEMNARLRDAIANARANNMPNDNIKNAIKRASGSDDSTHFDEITYEGYAPYGVAIIVNAMTDNRNRTAGEVRHVFEKYGGNLGTTGCVSYMFDKKGVIIIEKEELAYDQDELMMIAIDAGAEDFNVYDEVYEILTKPKDFSELAEEFENKGIKPLEAGIEMVPQNYTKLDEKQKEELEKIIELLEDLDDVQSVFHNFE